MADPYIGEIRMFGGSFAPVGWAFCNGQVVPISENDSLFSLIGTTYGGDGESTFGLPNLMSRIPVMSDYGGGGWGTTWVFGQLAGTESETITTTQLPVHTHALMGSTNPADQSTPANNVPALLPVAQQTLPYGTDVPLASLDPTSVTPVGGSQPHENTQPFLVISFIIAMEGIYPHT